MFLYGGDMKYILLIIPFIKYGITFLEATNTIPLNAGNISVISVLENVRIDSVANFVISMIITYVILRNIKTEDNFKNFIINAVFVIYINELYSLVLYIYMSEFLKPISSSPYLMEGAINLVPFENISLIFYSKVTFIQVVGNALMLSPLAFFIHYYGWSKNYKKTFFKLFGLIVFIELFQLSQTYIYSMYTTEHMRACDIDDFILNSLSVIVGINIFKIYNTIRYTNNTKLFKSMAKAK